ncbi:hypothetical protein ABMA27_010579 [Loxostege sticticalis]|uniref:Major facilitator superfamily (MFS) profile domain-containing protein n=1 Tax=Loxostege sticticalis TaxID=481309 RepID=A0ABR3H3J6_LOXSC
MSQWICIVTTGASVNMAATTLVMAYSSGLVLQLRRPHSEVPVDKSIESWIAASPAISGLIGSSLAAVSMACLGRWISQIASITTLIIGWSSIIFAKDVAVILIGRFFHGLAMGSSIILTPIMVSEYASPRYRGAFMMFMGVLSGIYVLLSHTTALYLHWRTNAVIGAVIAIANLPVAIYSPESPSWLSAKQRYDDCRRAFRWLRGDDEEEELANMIKASEISHKLERDNSKPKSEMSIKNILIELKKMVLKKEFYKPIFVMMHAYVLGQWAGGHLFNTYIFDIIEYVVGKGHNEQAMGLNINRLLGAILSTYIITKTKRKTMFLVFSGLNAMLLFITAAYAYAKSKDLLPFESPIIGLVFLHLLMFCITAGTLPLPYIIAGEVFPLKYKSISSGFCLALVFINTSAIVKSFPYLLSSIGIYGAFTMYGSIVSYCLLIAYLYLPETKDRTLQEIEEEMIGKPANMEDLKSVQSLINKPVNKEID